MDFDPKDFDVTSTIAGLQYSATDPANATTLGAPIPSYTPLASTGWDNGSTPDTLVFNSADGFEGLTNGGPGTNNLLVRGFDDENTGLDTTDLGQFYADSFSVLITPKAEATFGAETVFVFSFDGDRSFETVPEPTSSALLGLGGLGFLLRRSRR